MPDDNRQGYGVSRFHSAGKAGRPEELTHRRRVDRLVDMSKVLWCEKNQMPILLDNMGTWAAGEAQIKRVRGPVLLRICSISSAGIASSVLGRMAESNPTSNFLDRLPETQQPPIDQTLDETVHGVLLNGRGTEAGSPPLSLHL